MAGEEAAGVVTHCYDWFELERVCGGPLPHVMAERLGCNVKTVHEWRRRRWLTFAQADAMAVRAGFHPHEVWGAAFSDETTALFARIRTEREEAMSA